MKVWFDLDGVLVDSVAHAHDLMRRHLSFAVKGGATYERPVVPAHLSSDHCLIVDGLLSACWGDPEFMRTAPEMFGMVQVVQQVAAAGLLGGFITARPATDPMHDATEAWLQARELDTTHLVFGANKLKLIDPDDLLFDDKPGTFRASQQVIVPLNDYTRAPLALAGNRSYSTPIEALGLILQAAKGTP